MVCFSAMRRRIGGPVGVVVTFYGGNGDSWVYMSIARDRGPFTNGRDLMPSAWGLPDVSLSVEAVAW